MKNGQTLWTIDELGVEVATALAAGYGGAPNGRVRDVPDRRTIRYYTTLGLIDRPVEMRGRTAFYGPRHLLQLVAIKKLQSRGQTLAEVQRVLAGITDKGLAVVAGLESHGKEGADVGVPKRPSRQFWREAPSSLGEESSRIEANQEDNREPESEPDRPQTFHGISLHDGVTLLLASSRAIDPQEIEAIRVAAGPLIDILLRCQLIHSRVKGESS